MPDTRPQRVTWPPRLVGVLFEGRRPFGGAAYLAIDSLTVLLGANGAGKTTTLRILQQQLPSTAAPTAPPEDELRDVKCTFFVEVTDEQLVVLVAEQLA